MAKYNDHILLTGAGFTHNFGGFLGKEMWVRIFNNPLIQKEEAVKQLLLKDFDFESAYAKVMSSDQYAGGEERPTLAKVIEETYKSLDDVITAWEFNQLNPTALNTYGVGTFIGQFAGDAKQKGLFFTLNQDLFIEKNWGHMSPGAHFKTQLNVSKRAMSGDQFITLPDEAGMEKVKADWANANGVVYIKLHGSYGWLSAGQRNSMVIGKNKTEVIDREPLLKWYFEIFREAIAEGNKKILIIGYGFGDQHINQILLEGVEKHGLKLYIITTTDPDEFVARLHNGHYYALPLWAAVRGYFPYSLREIFPPNQQETMHYKEIMKALRA
jgi:hypothetical protein